MEFWASSETYQVAGPRTERIRRLLEPLLNDALNGSGLAAIDIKVRYIPIAMPVAHRDNYPARSKVREKERIFDCAPQLDYEIFLSGGFEQQVTEYVRGILSETSELKKLGLSEAQVREFDAILVATAEKVALQEGA